MNRLILPLALLMVATASVDARAAWVNLTAEQIEQALAHGKTSYERARAERRPIDDLEPEYIVDLGPDVGHARLFTEFSTLALEARRWQAINQPLGAADIERILAPLRGRLQISVLVVGSHPDFLRHHRARLHQATRTHEPVTWDIFRGFSLTDAPGKFAMPGQYSFSARDLDPNQPVTLVLRDQDGHEIRFEFDLGRLR